MGNSTRIPAAVDALLEMTAGMTVPAFDGAPVGEDALTGWVEICTNDPDRYGVAGEVGAHSEITWAGLGAKARDETFTIRCAAVSWNGDSDSGMARRAAFTILAEVEAVLFGDPTLINTVLYARVSDVTLRPTQDDAGATAFLLFDIECRARLAL